MYRFEDILILQMLWGLVPLLVSFAWWVKWRKKAKSRLGDKVVTKTLFIRYSSYNPLIKFVLCLLAFITLVLARANPYKETNSSDRNNKSADVVFVVDVSLSMLAGDVAPNRLERAKQIISRSIHQLKGEQVGVVAFAGQPTPLVPLTNDFRMVGTRVNSLIPQQVKLQGSSISQALQTSFQLLLGSAPQSSVVFLLSDGEIHQERVSDILPVVKNFKGKVCTIGIGKESGGNILLSLAGEEKSYKTDSQGNIVLTRLNEGVLKQIASQGQGTYHYSEGINETVSFINKQIGTVNAAPADRGKSNGKIFYFRFFICLTLVILLVELYFPSAKL